MCQADSLELKFRYENQEVYVQQLKVLQIQRKITKIVEVES